MADDFVLTNPIDHTLNSAWPDEVRNVKKIAVGAGLRFYYAATPPASRYDATAFATQDLGSLWVDSDDNHIYILTAIAGPTWTDFETIIEAMTLIMASTDCTLTLQNTVEEDIDGGRQSSLRFKGEQSGTEETTLAYIEASHDGTADDQKGQLKIAVNDGDDADAPSKVALTISSDGKIVETESLMVLDEDDMATDSAVQVPTQQSVKAFGTMVPAVTGAGAGYAAEESVTLANGMIIKMGNDSVIAGDVTITFGAAFPNAIVSVVACQNAAVPDNNDMTTTHTPTTSSFKIASKSTGTASWIAIGY